MALISLMSPIRKNLDFMYMFVSQHQPLQIAGNTLLMVFFHVNYYFANKLSPVFDRYPPSDDLNGSISNDKLGKFKSLTQSKC